MDYFVATVNNTLILRQMRLWSTQRRFIPSETRFCSLGRCTCKLRFNHVKLHSHIHLHTHKKGIFLKQHSLQCHVKRQNFSMSFSMSPTAVRTGPWTLWITEKLSLFLPQLHSNVIVRALCPPQSDMRDLSPGPLGLTAKHNDTHADSNAHTHTHIQSEADESHLKDYSCA